MWSPCLFVSSFLCGREISGIARCRIWYGMVFHVQDGWLRSRRLEGLEFFLDQSVLGFLG